MPAASGKRFKPSKYVPVSAAAIFLVGATTLFFAFTCPGLSLYVSPVIPVYNAIVFLFVLANFSMATFMDPGIFPRAEEDEDKEDDFRAPLYKTVEIKGIQVRMKWCATCRFYRPPRCSHCSVCDNCVEEFDHHCPWVNNCIGRRNYRYFFLFLLSLTTHIMGVFGFGLLYVLYQVEELSGVRMAVTYPLPGCRSGAEAGGPSFRAPPSSELSVTGGTRRLQALSMSNGLGGNESPCNSKGSLEVTESQSADAEPPPPPKPDLSRYTGLRTHLTLATNEDSSLLGKDSPPTPTMYKYRPGYSSSSSSAALPHSTSAKLSRVNSLKEPNSICESSRQPNYRSEPSLEPESFRSPTFGKSFHFDPLSSGSRSSSLKSAQGTGFEMGHLQSIRSEGTTSTSYKSLVNQTRNGSLSYDSLLTPSDSPDFESVQAGPEPDPPVGYTSPFLSARIAQQRETDLHGRFAGAVSPKHAPPREPSPVRYDNLSRHIVASIQEREKLLQQPPATGKEEDAGLVDSGLQSTPGSSNAPRTSSSSDDSKRSPLGKNPLTRPQKLYILPRERKKLPVPCPGPGPLPRPHPRRRVVGLGLPPAFRNKLGRVPGSPRSEVGPAGLWDGRCPPSLGHPVPPPKTKVLPAKDTPLPSSLLEKPPAFPPGAVAAWGGGRAEGQPPPTHPPNPTASWCGGRWLAQKNSRGLQPFPTCGLGGGGLFLLGFVCWFF
uniref:Palmitoyltransferase n=1 Tax=Athene cunicularia TaxID=194338 RepID=A0A663M279_ATHCN